MTITRRTAFDDLPQFLSPAEYAAFTGLGKTAIYEALRKNEIPSRTLGGRRKWIPRSFLLEGETNRSEEL